MKFGDHTPIVVKKDKGQQAVTLKKRASVKPDGVEQDGHTQYNSEVAFANIRATANVCRVKDDHVSSVGVVRGPILEGVPITVPSNTAGATAHAMKKRCDYAPAVPDITQFNLGHKLLMEKFDPLDTIRVDKELIDRYIVTCSPAKAEKLLRAFESGEYKFDGNTKHVFAKQEVLLKDHGAQPRVVYQGTDMYNLLTGCVAVELQRRMKEVFSRRNPKNTGNVVIFACGVSGEELGDIIHSTAGEALESDMENNDGSQGAELRRPEAMFYAKMGAPMWYVREFAKNTSVRVWTRYGIEATVDGGRWSGETTTTPGNSYVGIAGILAAAWNAGVKKSVQVHGGDDFLGYYEKSDVAAMKEHIPSTISSFGMKAKVAEPLTRAHGTFYRKRYVSDIRKTRPVPQFGRVLAKLNVRANLNSSVGDREYMAGKYYSAAYEHRFVPILSKLLVSSAQEMSDKPYFDERMTKLAEMGTVEQIVAKVESADCIDENSFSDFLQGVYGIGIEDLVYEYGRAADGCKAWLDGYTFIDKRGKHRTKSPPPVTKIGGQTIEALLRHDL
jgi:hypothetical protein